MLPINFELGAIAAANAALFASSQTPVSGVPLTLTGTEPDVPRRALLTYGNEGSARTLVLVGTNPSGNPIKETLAVPSGGSGTVATIQDFGSLISALPLGGGWTAPVTLGTNIQASSEWKLLNNQQFGPAQLTISGTLTGTATWGIEFTLTNVNSNSANLGSGPLGNYPPVPNPIDNVISALWNQTASSYGTVIDYPWVAWRAMLIDGSGGGSVLIQAIEAGVTNR